MAHKRTRMSESPLVSCICPTTYPRFDWLRKAIDCFLSQTYENKEMVIVIDGIEIPDWYVCHPNVRWVFNFASRTLGNKRNLCCLQSRGSIIAHFDDDDWSAPTRLADQVTRLVTSRERYFGVMMTGYSQMKFTDGEAWWRYIGDPTWPLGTSLMYFKSWWEGNVFQDVQVGSDTHFIWAAQNAKAVTVVPCEDRMFASVHTAHVSPRCIDNTATYQPISKEEGIYPYAATS
jgi:glycosyltransferase involved in cell wall biosynthesis